MPQTQLCPQEDVLRRLVLGEISAREAEPLEDHLADCPRCATALGRIDAIDSIVEVLRTPWNSLAAVESEQTRVLINRCRQLRPRGDAQTLPPASPTDPEQTCVDGGGFPLLAPAQALDELGRLGPYRVLSLLGRGGMGMVYLAEDPRLRRQVALKVIKPEMVASGDFCQRFLHEAQAIAALEHDNIVAIHEVNEERGVPYLVMPLLQGQTLEDRLRGAGSPLPLPEILRVGRETASALAAAHARGLIHRDVKPGNLWLEQKEGEPARIKVLDFGLVHHREAAAPEPGKIVGTPAFMAPEQAQGLALDHRADLFSLGCVLYQAATARPAFQGEDLLSTVLAVTTIDPVAPEKLNRHLPPALTRLIVQLLDKDPDKRPASAQAVVEALAKIEESLRPRPSRWRWWLGSAVAVLAAAGLTFWLLPPSPVVAPPVEPAEVTLTCDDPDPRVVLTHGEDPPRTVDLSAVARLVLAPGDYQVRLAVPRPGRELQPGTLVVKPGEPLRVELRLVGEVRRDSWHSRAVWAVALAPRPNPLLAVSASDDRSLRRWNAARAGESTQLGEHQGPVRCLAVSPDGRRVLSGGGAPAARGDFAIHLWDLEKENGSGSPLARFPGHTNFVKALAFAPDGQRFLSGGVDGKILLWDVRDAKPVRALAGHEHQEVYGLAFSPDGRQAISCGRNQTLCLWDVTTGERLKTLTGHRDPVSQVCFSPAGTEVFSASGDGTLAVWDLARGTRRELRGHRGRVLCLAPSPDGQRILSGGNDGTVRLWQVATGEVVHVFEGHRGPVQGVAFAADGRHGLSGGSDGTVRLWALPR